MCRYLKSILYVMFFMSVLHVTSGEIKVFQLLNDEEDDFFLSDRFNSTELPYSLKEYDVFKRRGKLVLANPPDACSPILGPSDEALFHLFSYNWFVLIDGSSCDYITKVSNAQSAGFSAAVIYVYKRSNDHEHEEILQGSLPNIIAVLINFYDGITMRDKYLYTKDKSYVVQIGPINDAWLIWFGGALAVVAVICVIAFLFDNYGYFLRDCQCPNLKKRIHLKELEIFPFKTAYHAACIDEWLTEGKGICLVCKIKIFFKKVLPHSEVTINQSEATPLLHS